MVRIGSNMFIILFTIFLPFQPGYGFLSENGLCSAKFDSMYEDACVRGYHMSLEAEKNVAKDLHGVTCENSCSDVYKSDAQLVSACKYGCNIKVSSSTGDDHNSPLYRLRTMIMDQLKNIQNLFNDEPTMDTFTENEHLNQDTSDVQPSGTVIRHIRIFFPLGHPERETIQRSPQLFNGEANPLEKLKIFLGLSNGQFDDQAEESVHEGALHLNQELPSDMHPNNYAEKDMNSLVDKFFFFIGNTNPIIVFLLPLFFIAVIAFLTQLCICVCRRRTRHTYLYPSLPSDLEVTVPYYGIGIDGKKIVEEKSVDVKDTKETLNV